MRLSSSIVVSAAVLVLGCDSVGGAENDIVGGGAVQVTSQEVSNCGGFAVKADSGEGYCDAEVLAWTFDAAAGSLSLVDRRVPLNCCGRHAMDLSGADGAYTATETDALPDNGSRCRCDCVYDFRVAGTPVKSGSPITLTLVRDVTGQDGYPKTVWTGTLDLSAGSGNIVIDVSPVPMGCEAP